MILLALSSLANAGDVDVGGYFRVAARPDLQGGDGKLGYWNLYGRLLNEGSYAAVEMRWELLERDPSSHAVWSSLHAKIEGGSIANADGGNGRLDQLRLSQVYAEGGNILLDRVTWRIGTLDLWYGSLGLYDMWPARIFSQTIGLSANVRTDVIDLTLGFGDSGFGIRGPAYNSILTPGAALRVSAGKHLEFGVGGEAHFEPYIPGNVNAPYQTPGVAYEDYVRGEVVTRWVEDNPNLLDYFPDPEGDASSSWKLIGYLGFGQLGPLRWNNLFASLERLHPDTFTTESYQGADFDIYIRDLTDQRYHLDIGNEVQLVLWPERLEAVVGFLYGHYWDVDNDISPSDHDRTFASTVVRLQAFATPTVHFLVESSLARETSENGNAYRSHWDSIFSNTDGLADTRGLESGDASRRDTWQGKAGVVLNPLGPGIFSRPSLRLLYGVQYSTQQAAFGNSFLSTLDQFNDFELPERDMHWHHLAALETEVWF